MNIKKEKREEHQTRIGPLLKDVLNKQKEKIKDATYGCVPASDYQAGEILAKKIIAKKII